MSRFSHVRGLSPAMSAAALGRFRSPRKHPPAGRNGHVRGLSPVMARMDEVPA
jgi:hypothetical protein